MIMSGNRVCLDRNDINQIIYQNFDVVKIFVKL